MTRITRIVGARRCAALIAALTLGGCGQGNEAQPGEADAPAASTQSVPQSIPMGGAKSVTRFFVTSRGLCPFGKPA